MRKGIILSICLLPLVVHANSNDELRNIVVSMSSIAIYCNSFASAGYDVVTAKLNGIKKENLTKSLNDSDLAKKILDEGYATNLDANEFRDYYFNKCINESTDRILSRMK